MITGIDHIEFCVGNIEEVAAYFAKMGFTEVARTDHHGGAIVMKMPGEQGTLFEFHVGKDIEAPGLNHIAFKVDDMQKTYETFTANGVPFVAPPKFSERKQQNMANSRCPAHMRYQFVD
mgnify:CR=1 FL=1